MNSEHTATELNNALLQALLTATDEQKHQALSVLRGETIDDQKTEVQEPYLTQREVARQLNLSACSLWRWQIPGHKLAGRPRYRMSEVLAYLESPAFQERANELQRRRRQGDTQKDE